MDKEFTKILFSILKSQLKDAQIQIDKEKLTKEVISSLYNVSKKHDVAHIVCAYLEKNGFLKDHFLADKFYSEEIMSVCRYEQQKYALQEITNCFREQDIAYITLKGFVIRPYYPQESMRTSCDIDILIKEQDLQRAISALEQNGYSLTEKGFHDVSLFSPSGVHLELHFSLLENKPNIDKVLKDAWQYAQTQDGVSYSFTEEFFIFHIYAHIWHHFLSGGCGIRSLMDLWIIKNKMGIDYQKASSLLKKAGIEKLAKEIDTLAQICFDDKIGDEFYDNLLDYIVLGGIYGSFENRVAVKGTDSVVKYSFKRIFLPLRLMKPNFPVLNKAPFLLPFCWIARIFQTLFGKKRKTATQELKVAKNFSSDKKAKTEQMRQRLGLR